MKKIYILDTNVLMYDPKALFAFTDNDVVIPLIVLDELDKHKNGNSQAAQHARMAIRFLDELRALGSICDGVKTEMGGTIRVELNHADNVPSDLDPNRMDNRIIGVALTIQKESDLSVQVITKDINLRVKCDALGVMAEDYTTDSVIKNIDALYTGHTTIYVDPNDIDELYTSGTTTVKNITEPLSPNEYVHLKSISGQQTGVGKFDGTFIKKVRSYKNIWGISPRNLEQTFAFDALFDQNIKLVSISGKAGTGKTLISCAAAVSQTLDLNIYNQIVLTRPIQPMGKDLGYLPGPQPLDAKILTPNGWTTMGKIRVGDLVIARNGRPSKVLGIYPKGEKEVYKVETTNGQYTECCIDHLWNTQTKENKKRKKSGSVKTTKQIMETLYDKNNKLNHYLPINGPVQFEKKQLPIPPYTLGALIGDGSLANTICISSKDNEIIKRVAKELKQIDCEIKVSSGTQGICDSKMTIDDIKYEFLPKRNRCQNIKDKIYFLGLQNSSDKTKFIPRIYLESSVNDRINLLRGLMDTDGTIKKNGEASFCTISYQLAKDVVELVRSLGGNANIRKRNRVGHMSLENNRKIICKNESYEFSISLPQNINPFYLSRKASRHKCNYICQPRIKNIEKCGKKPVQCIMIDDPEHLYITDDYIVTHNTKEEKMLPWMAPLNDNLNLIFSEQGKYYLEACIDKGIIEIEPLSYIRGRSIPKSFIILDESQNLSKHEVKTLITRVGEGSKVVITGDIEQIDSPNIDAVNNGLTQVIEAFKNEGIAAHITLSRGERSELSTLAAEKL